MRLFKFKTCVATLLLLLFTSHPGMAQEAPFIFTEDFEVNPTVPTPWNPDNWDVSVHLRSTDAYRSIHPMDADHGMDCDGPPLIHAITTYEETVFNCRDHMMTSINGSDYGVIYLTPDHLVDFSEGEAVVQFNMSTLRKSGRDWIDLWVSPFEEHLQMPLQDWGPDLQGEPRRGIHIRMDLAQENSRFIAGIIRDHDFQELDATSAGWQGYEYFLTPDQKRRDLFELRLSKTHLAFGMPEYNFWWYDTEIPALNFDLGVVQLGHHSYNPTKDCPVEDACLPNTWHWDNVTIAPARPFTIIKATSRYTEDGVNNGRVLFKAPAPANAYLRFSGIGTALEVSFDGGVSWQTAQKQPQEVDDEGHFSSYFTPVPEGVDAVTLRGDNWWGGAWHARSFSIWSLETGDGQAVALTPLEVPGRASTLHAAYPNPFNTQTQFTLSIPRAQQVSIQVFDMLGHHVRTLFEGLLTPDEAHNFTFEAGALPAGPYVIRASGANFNQVQPVLILK